MRYRKWNPYKKGRHGDAPRRPFLVNNIQTKASPNFAMRDAG
jgi:hypothetical protein